MLLLRWQEEYDAGRDLSAEELCRDCPDQQAEVAQVLAALRQMHRLRRGTLVYPGDGSGAAALEQPAPTTGRWGQGLVFRAWQVKLNCPA
jgi:hypothetical protein